MNIRRIADHSVDIARLPDAPVVLDIGSRGSRFADGIRELRPKALVIEVDPDPSLKAIHVAIVGTGEVTQTYARYSTGEGNHLGSGYGIADASPIEVPCMSIDGLMRVVGVRYWDVVKIDCEGSEFGILEHWPGPIAGQISVEFHDAFDRRKRNDEYFAWLFSQMERHGYFVISHKKTTMSSEAYAGHWDSLLALKATT